MHNLFWQIKNYQAFSVQIGIFAFLHPFASTVKKEHDLMRQFSLHSMCSVSLSLTLSARVRESDRGHSQLSDGV